MIILYLILPVVCIAGVALKNRQLLLAEKLVYGVLTYEVVLLVTGIILGSGGLLRPAIYAGFLLGLVAVVILAIPGAPSPREGRLSRARLMRCVWTRRGMAAAVSLVMLAVGFSFEVTADWLSGTRHCDGLWYHIPRMIFWVQQHNFNPWATPVSAQIGLPVAGDVILGQKVFLGRGWNGIGYITGIISLGAMAALYLAAKDLGLSRWQSLMTSLLFGSFPTIGLRIWAVNTDIVAAFPALASYVVLIRMRNATTAASLFVVLNAVAIACKPTIGPVLMALDGVAMWRFRGRLREVRWPMLLLPLAIGVLLIFLSYIPVYQAFGDFLGGDYSKAHKTRSAREFFFAFAMHTGHWLIEPLGYLTPFDGPGIKKMALVFYNAIGARFATLPEMWKPWPAMDIGYTGLAPLLALPFLATGFPRSAWGPATLLFLLSYVPLSGMIQPQPYFARYNVVILPAVALIWGGCRYLSRGKGRWVFSVVVLVNILALVGVAGVRFYVDYTVKMRPGGTYDYISPVDRKTIAESLRGAPIIVVSDGTMDALLVGPHVDYELKYLISPADGDWKKAFRDAGIVSSWLALAHGGERALHGGSEWSSRVSRACPDAVPIETLEHNLSESGWQLYRRGVNMNLWRKIGHSDVTIVQPSQAKANFYQKVDIR